MRSLVGELIDNYDRPTILDMEAGVEHLSRGTTQKVDSMFVIMEPYFKSLETGSRINKLAKELGIPNVFGVANKVRNTIDEEIIKNYCKKNDIRLLGIIPHDDSLIEADQLGISPIDHPPCKNAINNISILLKEHNSIIGNS